MSLIAEYSRLQQEIATLQARHDLLKSDPKIKQEMEFETKFRDLLAQYGKSLRDVISILEPVSHKSGKSTAASSGKVRKQRTVKIYRNPLTGESVESRGGNNKLLASWKTQFGHDEVENWVQK